MMLPNGKPLYQNLSTSFANLSQLVADLNVKQFSGYVRVTAHDQDGVLFLADGGVAQAVAEGSDYRETAAPAVERVTGVANDPGGVISVYEVPSELVGLLVRSVESVPVYENLSSGFTSIEKLVEKLCSEGHTGYIDATFGNRRGFGVIYFESGKVVEAVLSSEGDSVSGPDVVTTILEAAASVGATFDVYRAAGPAAPAVPTPVDPEPEQARDHHVAHEDDALAAQPAPTNGKAAVGTAHPPVPANGKAPVGTADLLEVWQEILVGAEAVVDELARGGRFLTTFKEVLIEYANAYPFLDPFAAEFDYRAGVLTFDGTPPEDFSMGLGECLRDVISRLSLQLRRPDLESRIRDRLSGMDSRHAAVIDRFALVAAAHEILA